MCLACDAFAVSSEHLRTRRRCCRTLKFARQRVSLWYRNSVATRRGKSVAEFTAPGASQILPCLWHFDEILPCLLHPSPSASQDVPNPYLTRTFSQNPYLTQHVSHPNFKKGSNPYLTRTYADMAGVGLVENVVIWFLTQTI